MGEGRVWEGWGVTFFKGRGYEAPWITLKKLGPLTILEVFCKNFKLWRRVRGAIPIPKKLAYFESADGVLSIGICPIPFVNPPNKTLSFKNQRVPSPFGFCHLENQIIHIQNFYVCLWCTKIRYLWKNTIYDTMIKHKNGLKYFRNILRGVRQKIRLGIKILPLASC